MKFSVAQYRGRYLAKTLHGLFSTSVIDYWNEKFRSRFGRMICGLVSDDVREIPDHDAKFTFLALEMIDHVAYDIYEDEDGKVVAFCEEELINMFNGSIPCEIYFKAGMDAEFET